MNKDQETVDNFYQPYNINTDKQAPDPEDLSPNMATLKHIKDARGTAIVLTARTVAASDVDRFGVLRSRKNQT